MWNFTSEAVFCTATLCCLHINDTKLENIGLDEMNITNTNSFVIVQVEFEFDISTVVTRLNRPSITVSK